MKDGLIFNWNATAAGTRPSVVLLDDETLRDGLQSPSVRTPTIDQKIRILHLIDSLEIDSADIGLPGAGPHVVRDVERLAREIGSARLKVRANCAARTHVNDILERPLEQSYQAQVIEGFDWESWIDPARKVTATHERTDTRLKNYPYRSRPIEAPQR